MPRLPLCLTALLLLAPAARAQQQAAPDGKQVEEAITRGAEALIKQVADLDGSGTYGRGKLALATFALLRAGASPKRLSQQLVTLSQGRPATTYGESLVVLAFTALGSKVEVNEGGTRTYTPRRRLPKAALEQVQKALGYLLEVRNQGSGSWGYGRSGRQGDGAYDNSNTQFAVYALHAAEEVGLRVPDEVWGEVLLHFLGDQEPDGPAADLAETVLGRPPAGGNRQTRERAKVFSSLGDAIGAPGRARGWGYQASVPDDQGQTKYPASYTMTPAGLGSLGMAVEALGRRRRGLPEGLQQRATEALRDALAWLHAHWANTSLAHKKGRSSLSLYEYYAVEKALDGLRITRLGHHDWWAEGAEHLLKAQNENGSWGDTDASVAGYTVKLGQSAGDRQGNVIATSLALLFLTRATMPADGGAPSPVVPPRPVTGGD